MNIITKTSNITLFGALVLTFTSACANTTQHRIHIPLKSSENVTFCDEHGNRYLSEEQAEDAGLTPAQYGATYCPEYLLDTPNVRPRWYDLSWPILAVRIDEIDSQEVLPETTNLSYDKISYDARLHLGTHGFYRGDLILDDHTGTHIDAPNHYVFVDGKTKNAPSIGEITMSELIGPLVMLDVSTRSDKNIYPSDIEPIIPRLQNGAWLIVNFDSAKLYKTDAYSTIKSPGFVAETCRYIGELIDANKIDISGIGSDSGSTDVISSFENANTTCHALLLAKRNVLLLEALTDLNALANDNGECEIVASPLKIVGASASPARVYARCD